MLRLYFIRHGESTNNVLAEKMGACDRFYQERNPDPPLTSLGESQAHCVGRRMAHEVPELSQIWCSYLHRAISTAHGIFQEHPKSPQIVLLPGIAELGGYYCYCPNSKRHVASTGPNNAQILERFSWMRQEGVPVSLAPEAEGGWNTTTQRENAPQARKRADSLVSLLEQRCLGLSTTTSSSSPVLDINIITHGDFFECVMGVLFNKIRAAAAGRKKVNGCSGTKGGIVLPGEPPQVRNTSVTCFTCSVERAASDDVVFCWRLNYIDDISHLETEK